MNLVIGGAYQGKRQAAMRLFGLNEDEILDGAVCTKEELRTGRAVYDFHLFLRRLMEQQEDPAVFYEELAKENPGILLISNEIGYGIVPLDRFERDWREASGRICCLAAQQSDSVIRVIAGIPTFIKGELR